MFILNLTKKILILPLFYKKVIVLFSDIFICIIAFFISIYLRTGSLQEFDNNYFIANLISIFLMIVIFYKLNMYSIIFRFYDHRALLLTIKSVSIYLILYCTILFYLGLNNVPRTIGVIQPLVFLVLLYISRSSLSQTISFFMATKKRNFNFKNIIIYGAGGGGQRLANNFYINPLFKIIYFYDDDESKQSRFVAGLKVLDKSKFKNLVKKKLVDEIWLAIPSLDPMDKLNIVNDIQGMNVKLRVLPDISNIKEEYNNIKDLRPLNINELLGRIEHKSNENFNLKNKTVVVVGAGGTIGSNLCLKIIKSNLANLILIETSEFALYNIHSELEQIISKDNKLRTKIIPILGSINDKTLLKEVFSKWLCNIVFHAAAYKHVPLVELNIVSSLRNNIFGTLNLIEVSKQFNVEKFILISTDKAVKPTNVMGVSKRIAELIAHAHSLTPGKTIFTTVRFGNVIGSSGSVIPKFIKQIRDGGPITLTHRNVTRFFMSVEEATDLVIQAGDIAKGGEIFLLDMGEPVNLYDLILRIVKLEGRRVRNSKNLKEDIEIKIIGLRPGEKLYEELLITNRKESTKHPKIYKGYEPFFEIEDLYRLLDKLNEAIQTEDINLILSVLKELVPEYQMPKKHSNLLSL